MKTCCLLSPDTLAVFSNSDSYFLTLIFFFEANSAAKSSPFILRAEVSFWHVFWYLRSRLRGLTVA